MIIELLALINMYDIARSYWNAVDSFSVSVASGMSTIDQQNNATKSPEVTERTLPLRFNRFPSPFSAQLVSCLLTV